MVLMIFEIDATVMDAGGMALACGILFTAKPINAYKCTCGLPDKTKGMGVKAFMVLID